MNSHTTIVIRLKQDYYHGDFNTPKQQTYWNVIQLKPTGLVFSSELGKKLCFHIRSINLAAPLEEPPDQPDLRQP